MTNYACCSNCKHYKREYYREADIKAEGGEWYCDNKLGYFYRDLKERGDVCSTWEPYLGGGKDA